MLAWPYKWLKGITCMLVLQLAVHDLLNWSSFHMNKQGLLYKTTVYWPEFLRNRSVVLLSRGASVVRGDGPREPPLLPPLLPPPPPPPNDFTQRSGSHIPSTLKQIKVICLVNCYKILKSNIFQPSKRNVDRYHIFQIYRQHKLNQAKFTVYLFSAQLNKLIFFFIMWSFCLVYKHSDTYTYFIHYKWLLKFPYNVSLYYLMNSITYKTRFILSVFRKWRSSYFPAKNAHGPKDWDWHCDLTQTLDI